jgi:3-hydroxyacyl-CoA dehydrogenase
VHGPTCTFWANLTLFSLQIAAATARPKAVIGMHFMNPVPVMKLVEVI